MYVCMAGGIGNWEPGTADCKHIICGVGCEREREERREKREERKRTVIQERLDDGRDRENTRSELGEREGRVTTASCGAFESNGRRSTSDGGVREERNRKCCDKGQS